MFKRGIWHLPSVSRLQNPHLADVVSYQLLKDPVLEDPERQREAELLFEGIVKHLRLSSGIYRSTYPNRFADLDPVVNGILADIFGSGAAIEVHDWAASDCRVSAEWAAVLWDVFPRARVIASDLHLNLLEVSCNREAYIFEPDGTPLQYIRPPFVIPIQKPIPPYYVVNRMLVSRALRKLPHAREAALGISKQSSWTVKPITLIHPSARRLAATDARFEVHRHSVFELLPRKCQVIRTMNIFNLVYFDQQRLRSGAACVFDSLAEKGVWVLGKTTADTRPSLNSVSIFQKSEGALKLLQRLNRGSEIENLVLDQPLAL